MVPPSRFRERCLKCGKQFAHDRYVTKCDACSGLVDVEYDLKQVQIYDDAKDMIERYRDLIPVADPSNLIRVGAGNTPCVHAKRLGKLLGLENLYLKDETRNPTGTTKDRTASVVLSYFKELGIKHFTSSATGNSSTAFAVACIKNPPFEHSIFIGQRWYQRLTFDAHPRVHVWVIEGGKVNEAIAYSRSWERENGIPAEGGFFNSGRREGLKLAFLEAVDQTGISFDWYFQGVSTAMGAYGAYKGALEYLGLGRLKRVPKLGCIQETSCSPQYAAFSEGSPVIEKRHIIENPDGIADALLKGNPSDTYPYMYKVVKDSGGLFEAVTTEEIREARAAIHEYEGIPACNASSTTIAGIKKLLRAGRLGSKEFILANITGSDRNNKIYPHRYNKVVRTDEGGWRLVGEVTET